MRPVYGSNMTSAEATRRFYTHIWPLRAMVLRTARFLGGNASEADDLAQEALLKAFRAMDTFDETTNAKAWLVTILRNTHIDRLRHNARWAGQVSFDETAADFADSRPTQAPTADIHDPAALLEQFSDAQIIAQLQLLPEDIRWTLLLVDVEQMAYENAATILGVPAGTVKSRVHRGRQILRERLLAPPNTPTPPMPPARRTPDGGSHDREA
jgi:RNA polymerase sigma-70 factor, ECF subfamily